MRYLFLSLIAPAWILAASPSFIETLDLTGADQSKTKEILPSQYVEGLSDRKLDVISERLLFRLGKWTSTEDKKLSDEAIELLSRSFGLMDVGSEESLRKLLATKAKKYPKHLNNLPLIHFDRLGKLQNIFLSTAGKDLSAGPLLDFADSISILTESSCRPRQDLFTEINQELGLHTGAPVIDQKVYPCFALNSSQLANLLNRLLEKRQKKTLLKIEKENVREIKSYQEIVDALTSAGYEVEIFASRMAVDFFGFSVKNEKGEFAPIRFATWFEVELPDGKMAVLGEHSELNLVVHSEGKRLAQVRFYHGIPLMNAPFPAAYWRPDHDKKPRWYALKRNSLTTDPDEGVEWLESAKEVSEVLTQAREDFDLPWNAYGFSVCNDSLGLVAARYSARQNLSAPINPSAFPLIRASDKFSDYLSKKLELPESYFKSEYPTDLTLKDPAAMRNRLLKVFPDPERFRASFPEFADDLKRLAQ